MRTFLRATLLAALLFAGLSVCSAQFAVGINIGAPPPPRVVRVQPVSPGSGFVFVGGYWYPQGGHYRWHDGYWTRPPYAGAAWVAPRHEGGQYYGGYWGGAHAPYYHDHHWDNQYDRDHRHYDDHHDDHHGDHHDNH